MPTIGSLGIQLITPHLYLFDPCGFFPSVTSAELRQLGLTVIYLSDTSGAHSHGTIAEISGGSMGEKREEGRRNWFFFTSFFLLAKTSCVNCGSINKTGLCLQVC